MWADTVHSLNLLKYMTKNKIKDFFDDQKRIQSISN